VAAAEPECPQRLGVLAPLGQQPQRPVGRNTQLADRRVLVRPRIPNDHVPHDTSAFAHLLRSGDQAGGRHRRIERLERRPAVPGRSRGRVRHEPDGSIGIPRWERKQVTYDPHRED
jgi:hypothetical protein